MYTRNYDNDNKNNNNNNSNDINNNINSKLQQWVWNDHYFHGFSSFSST